MGGLAKKGGWIDSVERVMINMIVVICSYGDILGALAAWFCVSGASMGEL